MVAVCEYRNHFFMSKNRASLLWYLVLHRQYCQTILNTYYYERNKNYCLS